VLPLDIMVEEEVLLF